MYVNPNGPVVFVVSGLTSHVLGTLGVARRLLAANVSVEYWGESLCSRLVRKQGFNFHELPGVRYCHDRVLFDGWIGLVRSPLSGLKILSALRRRRSTMHSDLSLFEQALDQQLARQVPTLAILDPLLVGYYPLLRIRGIRCVLLQDKPLPLPDPLVPPPTSGLLPADGPLSRARIAFRWALERAYCFMCRVRSEAAAAVFLYTPDNLVAAVQVRAPNSGRRSAHRRVRYDLHFADLEEWVLGAPEIEFPRERALPDNVRYIGPCVDLQRIEVGSPIARAAEARYFVYVSMGTSMPHWSTDLSLLRRVITALGGIRGIQVVISAGTMEAHRMLRTGFKNVHVSPLLPQLRLLRAADLAITHAGANAVRECIAMDTPMLAFPREYDQHGNAARIVYHGLGLRGSRSRDNAASIRKQALRILADGRFSCRVREYRTAITKSEDALFASAARSVAALHV
jgi:zeaxanthin glucosyltransferase